MNASTRSGSIESGEFGELHRLRELQLELRRRLDGVMLRHGVSMTIEQYLACGEPSSGHSTDAATDSGPAGSRGGRSA